MASRSACSSVVDSRGGTLLLYTGEAAGLRVNAHLESLMGTNVVQLNDRNYMLKLQEQVMLEYEMEMDKLERMRTHTEKMRQRKLYIDGLQDTPYMDDPYRRRALSVGNDRRGYGENSSTIRSEEHPPSPMLSSRGRPSIQSQPSIGTSRSSFRRTSKSVGEPDYRGGQRTDPTVRNFTHKSSSAMANGHLRNEVNPSGLGRQRDSLLSRLNSDETVQGLYDAADMLLSHSNTKL